MPELAFHFIRPQWLLALLPLALLAWRLVRGGAGADDPWRRAIDAALLPLLARGQPGAARRRGGAIGLLAAGWAIAALALAGPTWQRKPQPVFQTTAARVAVLDLSTSMLADDVAPSRLERARFKVEDVLALGGEGQTGLVAYAGDAFAVAPLTRDANTVRALLAVLEPDLMPVQGSRADLGLLQAQKLLRQAGLSTGEVLLLADGVDPAHAADATRAAALLLGNGYRVSVIGIGAPGPGAAHAAFDAAALQAIAKAGGGRYLWLGDSAEALRALLDSGAQARVDQARADAGATAAAWVDQGPWLVLLLLPIAALAFRRNLLIEDRKAPPAHAAAPTPAAPQRNAATRTTAAGSALLAAALTLGAGLAPPLPAHASTWDDAWQRPDQQAAAAMKAGDYARAAQLATDAELRGSAEYKRGDYAAALDAFARASGPRADYNRGNALARLGRYADAVAAYDKALGADPGNADARANKATVEALLRKQQPERDQAGKPQSGPPQSGQPQQGHQQDGQPREGQTQGGQRQDDRQQGNEQASQQASQQGEQQGAQQGSQKGDQQHGGQGQGGRQQNDETQSGGSHSSAQAPGAASQAAAGASGANRGEPRQQASAGAVPQGPRPAQSFADAERRLAAANASRDRGDAVPPAPAASAAAAQPAPAVRPGAAGAASGEARPIPSEEQLAAEQWLRRIPDDPGGLLRRKFLYQYRQRAGGG